MQPERQKMHFEGSAYFDQKPAYAPILKPIVLLKNVFSAFYNLLLKVIWSELVEGKQTDSLASGLLFLLLCVLSLIFHRFGAYQQPITIAFLLLWMIDCQLALSQFRKADARSVIRLQGSKDWLVWDQEFPDGQHNHLKLNRTEIEQITIRRTLVYGGVFAEQLGLVWQIHLRLCDATEILVDEQRQVSYAFEVAQSLANQLQVPLIFKHSEGQGTFAWESVDWSELNSSRQGGYGIDVVQRAATLAKTFPKTIRVQKSTQQWQISSCWRWISGWRLVKQIMQKAGLFIFVLWMSSFMGYWGAFLHALLIVPGSSDSLLNLFSLLIPRWEWMNAVKIALVLLVLLVQGAKLSFEEHLLLDRNQLTLYRNTKQLAQVPLAAIQATLFVKQPDPVLLIVTADGVTEVDGLQRDIEFRAVLLALDQAIAELQAEA